MIDWTAVDWTAVQGIAAILALIVNAIVAFSLLISIKALRQAEATKESAIFIWALDRIREIRPQMNLIRDSGGDAQWLQANREQVMKVLDVLQMISFMAEEGLIERQRVSGMWGKSFVEQWNAMEAFVHSFRTQIGEPSQTRDGAFFARSFESFAAYCQTDLGRRFMISWSATKTTL